MALQSLLPNTSYSFAAPACSDIIIGIEGGSMAVTPSQSSQIGVYLRIDPSDADKFDFTVNINGVFSLQGKKKPGASGYAKVLMLVEAPVAHSLNLRAAGGTIDVGRHNGSITAQVGGGNIHIGSAAGSLTVTSSGGNISVDQMSGNVQANASGGSVRLAGISGKVNAEISGGSIDVSLASTPDAQIKSSGGSIRLRVDAHAAFNIAATATGGTVSILPPLVLSDLVGSHFNGPVNGGSASTATLNSSGGSIVVSAA